MNPESLSRPVRFGVHVHNEGPVQKAIELVQLAEELGYDSAWVGDSQLIMPEPYTLLAACALKTQRITLGMGISNVGTRHPTVVASGLAALSDLAPGRVAAVIGVGGSSHGSVGLKQEKLVDFRDRFELIARLLSGERASCNGRGVNLVWANPGRTRQVRLFVHAGGPKGQRQAGEIGCAVELPVTVAELPAAMDRVKAGAAEAGRTGDIEVCWWRSVSISNDWKAIKEHMAASMSMNLANSYRSFRQGAIREEELGVDIELARRVAEVYDPVEHATSNSRAAQIVMQQPDEVWKELIKTSLIGTPELVAERIREALRKAPISDIVISPRLSTEHMPVEKIMEIFAAQVRPLVCEK
jgi:alkanesulfonate monooxygenase SsuD/methylene tetrahydromethanopterin reductase-like flavin-dependent oxidoreductase (luciferase family)